MIKELQKRVHLYAKDKGFWDSPDQRNVPSKLALIHSEISEALEDYRSTQMSTILTQEGKPVGFPTELADVVIRVLDLAEFLNIDLEQEIELKQGFNESRPYKHGGKRC